MINYLDIDAIELSAMMASNQIYLIDVRNLDEVIRGVLPDAVHIPLAMIPEYDFTLAASADAKKMVFYCHSGIRSAQAAAYISEKFEVQTFNLRGGILAWGREGLPFVEYQSI
jgi:rhodanese-related sulfurtransferase